MIKRDSEFLRIYSLPWRELEVPSEEVCLELTRALRRDPNDITDPLWPIQCAALLETAHCGGLYGPMRPGSGKTLVSFLAATVLGAERPVLLAPANLRDITRRLYAEAAKRWRLHPYLFIDSYEMQSYHADRLIQMSPDLLVCDEAHNLSKDSGRTKRVRRVAKACNPRFVMLTGSPVKESVSNPHEIAYWALRQQSPFPYGSSAKDWGRVVDPPKQETDSVDPGMAREWLAPTKKIASRITIRDLRAGICNRIVSSRGVVATRDEGPPCDLVIEPWKHSAKGGRLGELIADLVKYGSLPDGQDLADDLRVNAVISMVSCGFWLKWKVQPPELWLSIRRIWGKLVRAYITRESLQLDTVQSVARAIDARQVEDRTIGDIVKRSCSNDDEIDLMFPGARPLLAFLTLATWRAVRPMFTPETVVVWETTQVIEEAAEWAKSHNGLVWSRNPAIGVAMEECGIPYFGNGGFDKRGKFIEDHTGPACLSVASNKEGRNLQHKWSRNLLLQPSAGKSAGAEIEQMISRTHRALQKEKNVYLYVNQTFPHEIGAWKSTKELANFLATQTGQPQRLTLATDNTGT